MTAHAATLMLLTRRAVCATDERMEHFTSSPCASSAYVQVINVCNNGCLSGMLTAYLVALDTCPLRHRWWLQERVSLHRKRSHRWRLDANSPVTAWSRRARRRSSTCDRPGAQAWRLHAGSYHHTICNITSWTPVQLIRHTLCCVISYFIVDNILLCSTHSRLLGMLCLHVCRYRYVHVHVHVRTPADIVWLRYKRKFVLVKNCWHVPQHPATGRRFVNNYIKRFIDHEKKIKICK